MDNTGAGLGRLAGRSKRRSKPPRQGWLALCLVDDKGRILANLANVMIALRNDPAVKGAFTFDEMAQTAMMMHPLPLAPKAQPAGNGPVPRQLRDEDISQLQEWLQHRGLPRVSRDTVWQAVDQLAREHRFHPVRQWLDGLVWDGTPRLSGALKTYFGATGNEDYLVAIGRMFFISMVARVFKPGCKVDYMIVLEGDQGIEKSGACRILAGGWFSDSLPHDIASKDAKQHLRGKWLIEVAELDAFTRAETEALKAFITRVCEQYRPPYGRTETDEPRQCVFIGTTNRAVYIKDETGGRRYWPVKVGRIDLEALGRDRDQLFAEAVDRYRHGEQWWPDAKFERQHIKPEQEARRDADAWEAKIVAWLDSSDSNVSRPPSWPKVLIWELAQFALGIEVGRLTRADQNRIAGALIAAGWERANRTGKGQWWARKEVNE